MFRSLFAAPAPTRRWATPPGTRAYAVGDIHGRLDLLCRVQDAIAADLAATRATRVVVVYLGDYVDRGEHSREVIDRLLDAPVAGAEQVCLRGNHEEFLRAFLDDVSVGPAWLMNGGEATLFSYGVDEPPAGGVEERLSKMQAALRERLPARHRAFLDGLRDRHREGDYLFVHAGIRPRVPIEAQSPHDLRWIRGPFLDSAADHGVCVVHGHSISDAPEIRPNRIGIDTGAVFTGRLTCLVLEGAERRFLQS